MGTAGASGRSTGRGEKLKLAGWGAGVVVVFLFHIAALVAAATGEGGAEVWSILLLIFAPLAVVGIIGGGVARAIRSESGSGTKPFDEETP